MGCHTCRISLASPHSSDNTCLSLLMYRPPPRINGAGLSLHVPYTLILHQVFRHLVHFHVTPDVVQPSLLGPPSFPALTCFSRLFLRKIVIGSMLGSLQMSSFFMWSFLVLPLAQLNILISVVCSFCVSFFSTVQHSDLYIISGLTMILPISAY